MYTNTHSYPAGGFFKSLDDIKDKKVTIHGLGLNGGGEACVRFFARYGAFVTVTDMKTEEQLASTLISLRSDPTLDLSRTRFVLGKHELTDFENADVVIKNPGIKYEGNKYLAVAKAIETDISVFLSLTKAPIIAVTGSKGKSSTVSAIHYGLCQAGFEAYLGGNITVSPLTFLEKTNEKTPVVLELSSWQLADLKGRGVLKPHISVLTKIVPDHQNWYHEMEAYVNDKKLIYADQGPEDYTLCMKDDEWGETFASETKAKVVWYGDTADVPVRITEAVVPGEHMRQNLTNAAIVMTLMGVPADKACSILAVYPGIAHRLEYFHSWKVPAPISESTDIACTSNTCARISPLEVRFFNDSAATVPDAVAAAIRAFNDAPVLLAGGTDKGLEFTPLADAADEASAIYLLEGTGTEKLIPELEKRGISWNGPYGSLDDMLAAFKADILAATNEVWPALRPEAGEVLSETVAESDTSKQDDETLEPHPLNVVFSPGATSFGMFDNEFDRGNKFKNKVTELF